MRAFLTKGQDWFDKDQMCHYNTYKTRQEALPLLKTFVCTAAFFYVLSFFPFFALSVLHLCVRTQHHITTKTKAPTLFSKCFLFFFGWVIWKWTNRKNKQIPVGTKARHRARPSNFGFALTCGGPGVDRELSRYAQANTKTKI